MKVLILVGIAAGVLLSLSFMACDQYSLIWAEPKDVTFALVLDTRAYDGLAVRALVKSSINDDPALDVVAGTASDIIGPCPNTSNQSWARLLCGEKLITNARYFLDFYIDVDASYTRSSGDLEGRQHFEVGPNATWSETKYFTMDLEAVP